MNVVTDEMATTAAQPSVVAIGVFDGLHRGHQLVIAQLVATARERGATPTVVTFDPHPAEILAPSRAPRLLMTLAQRLEGLAALGVEQVRLVNFTIAVAEETASEFVARVVVRELGAIAVVAGDDTHFGRNREGDTEALLAMGHEMGFSVVQCPTYGEPGRFSSTKAREALALGDLSAVSAQLGHNFALRGTVVHGDHRGREIGFPTANLLLADAQALPGLGIYATAVLVEGEWRAGAVSVGTRPQFYDEGAVLVEVYLPDFSGDLYTQTLDVVFLERLRGEATFESVEALIEQMHRDVAKTLEIFTNFTPAAPYLLK